MPLPTQDQLKKEAKDLDERLQTLKHAYTDFLTAWEKLEGAEEKELTQMREYIDKHKIHGILETISKIDNAA